jgi:hypothetical protein
MIEIHNGIEVIRDDLYPGGTKARYLRTLFEHHREVVYASPACGGAQVALATVAAATGATATIFCAQRRTRHRRTVQAEAIGARIIEVAPGYLSVTQARARRYCEETGAYLAPFGLAVPGAERALSDAATEYSPDEPDEVWCASGSGTLSRGLQRAWPGAEHHVVRVGRELTVSDVGSATVHVAPYRYEQACREAPPFPTDPHYEAKAWVILAARPLAPGRRVVFWSVLGC